MGTYFSRTKWGYQKSHISRFVILTNKQSVNFTFLPLTYKVVQLNVTPEIEELYELFEKCHSKK